MPTNTSCTYVKAFYTHNIHTHARINVEKSVQIAVETFHTTQRTSVSAATETHWKAEARTHYFSLGTRKLWPSSLGANMLERLNSAVHNNWIYCAYFSDIFNALFRSQIPCHSVRPRQMLKWNWWKRGTERTESEESDPVKLKCCCKLWMFLICCRIVWMLAHVAANCVDLEHVPSINLSVQHFIAVCTYQR